MLLVNFHTVLCITWSQEASAKDDWRKQACVCFRVYADFSVYSANFGGEDLCN